MKNSVRLCLLAFAASLSLLSACGGGGGGGNTKTDVITLSGSVVAPDASDADVTVTVGDESFTTKTDEEGNFEIEIESTDASALVSILTKLNSDLSFVELVGDIGTFGDLETEAGDDATLTSDENIRTNVSTLSTAESVLSDEAEEGEGKRAKAFTFGDGVDPDEALTLAAVLQLLIDNPDEFELPDGVTTTLQVARDATKREALRDDFEERAPTDFEATKQDLVGDVRIIGPAQASDVPPDLLAATLDRRGQFPLNSGGLVDGFEFEDDGVGIYFSNLRSVGMTWALDGPKLRVEFDEPVVANSSELADCDSDGVPEPRNSQITDTGRDIARLSPNAVSVTSTYTITTPNCPGQPSQTVTATIAKTVLRVENLQPFNAADVSGRTVALAALETESQLGNTQLPDDLLSFAAAGTGSGRYTAPAFSWAVADGTLNVNYGSGIQGRYRPVLGIDDVARVVLVDYTTPNGRFTDLVLSFPRDPAVEFTEAEIPGRYFQFGVGVENGGDPRLQGFRLRFDPDRGGAQEDDFIDQSGEVVTAADPFTLNWSLTGAGEVAINRFYDSSNGENCDPAVSSTCILSDRRILVPVNRSGERFYWLERRRIDEAGVDASDPQTFIARFYDRVPLDSAKSAMPATSRSEPVRRQAIERQSAQR